MVEYCLLITDSFDFIRPLYILLPRHAKTVDPSRDPDVFNSWIYYRERYIEQYSPIIGDKNLRENDQRWLLNFKIIMTALT